jgi:MSHA biogenesis protein MshN
MSVLNQMLRDLEKRGAVPDVVAAAGTATVARPVLTMPAPKNTRRRWIWAGVLAVCAGFVAVHTWLTYRVHDAGIAHQPLGARQFAGVMDGHAPTASNPAVATPAAAAPAGANAAAAAGANPNANVATAANVDTSAQKADAPRTPAAAHGSARATENDAGRPAARAASATPTSSAPRARTSKTSASAAAPTKAAASSESQATTATPAATRVPTLQPDPPAAPAVVRSASNVAPDVDRAADLIARGRSTEAIELLAQVLVRQPTHAGARSSLAALLAEAGRREQALHVLLAGSEIDPLRFAAPAAQVQAELGDLAGALGTLARVPPARRNAPDEALYGGLAQRAGDHMTAIAAYRRALAHPQAEAVWWVGLAVSLEATGAPAEARDAYARAAADARLAADVRRYVNERLAVLGTPVRGGDERRKAALADVF